MIITKNLHNVLAGIFPQRTLLSSAVLCCGLGCFFAWLRNLMIEETLAGLNSCPYSSLPLNAILYGSVALTLSVSYLWARRRRMPSSQAFCLAGLGLVASIACIDCVCCTNPELASPFICLPGRFILYGILFAGLFVHFGSIVRSLSSSQLRIVFTLTFLAAFAIYAISHTLGPLFSNGVQALALPAICELCLLALAIPNTKAAKRKRTEQATRDKAELAENTPDARKGDGQQGTLALKGSGNGHKFLFAIFLAGIAFGVFLSFRQNALSVAAGGGRWLGWIVSALVAPLCFRKDDPNCNRTLFRAIFLLISFGFLLIVAELGLSGVESVDSGSISQTASAALCATAFHFSWILAWLLPSRCCPEEDIPIKQLSLSGAIFSLGHIIGDLLCTSLLPIPSNFFLLNLTISFAPMFVAFVLFDTTADRGIEGPVINPPRVDGPTEEEVIAAITDSYHLTPREVDVFTLLMHGRDYSRIQEKLFLSTNTVKSHVRSIYRKLDIHSQQELIDIVEHCYSTLGHEPAHDRNR